MRDSSHSQKPRGSRAGQSRADHLRAYAESRGSTFIAASIIITGQAWLSSTLELNPVWLFPVLSAALLIGSVAVYRSGLDEPSRLMRWFARGVVGVLALANMAYLIMLGRTVFERSALAPHELFLAGVVLWVVNIAVFALAYWEIDSGGPEDRGGDRKKLPDLVFPQQQPDQGPLAPPNWKPGFGDYLYVSVTASTAFSPTDVMPFTGIAKLLMGVESTISVATLMMLVARAVGIANG
jgi:hypothetical protein